MAQLAFREPASPGGATLIFDVELIKIVKRALPQVAWPTNVDMVETSESGLSWFVVEPGSGDTLGASIAVAEYTLRNPGGGWVGGSNYANPRSAFNGPFVLTGSSPPHRFLTEAMTKMRLGSRILFRVPASQSFGQARAPQPAQGQRRPLATQNRAHHERRQA